MPTIEERTALPAGIATLVDILTGVARRRTELSVAQQVATVAPALAAALRDPDTRGLYAGRSKSFLVWSFPHSLALHASVHRPGHRTSPHDHGEAWAVYGVVAGPTRFSRYDRGPDPAPGVAALGPVRHAVLAPGQTEVIWPGQVHAVANLEPGWSWNLVVRSRRLDEISRARFDAETGRYRQSNPNGAER